MKMPLALLVLSLTIALPTQAQPKHDGEILNAVVVLDDSGSMDKSMGSIGTRMDAAKRAILTVLDTMPEGTRLGLVLLNRGWVIKIDENIPRNEAVNRIKEIEHGGTTLLGEYVKIGADALDAWKAKKRYGTYKLLVVTDGDASDPNALKKHMADIMTRGYRVECIGVDMSGDHSLATMVHQYRRADDPDALKQQVAEVFGETAVDTSSAGESDFDIIAALDIKLASAILGALANVRTGPIGQAPPVPVIVTGGSVQVDPQGNMAFKPAPSGGMEPIVILFAVLGGGLVVVVLLFAAARAIFG